MFLRCRSLTAVIMLLALMFMPGCGSKSALVPPQKLVPLAITDLRYYLDEKGLSLKWSFPAEMESGDELSAIENFEVVRAEIPEEDYCEGCPVRFEKIELIDGGPLPTSGESRTASYEEEDLRDGYRYLYKVRSRAGWWYPSNDSNIISFTWRPPPKAPGGLQVVAGDGKITLNWEPVKENIAGRLLGAVPLYQVYRKSVDTGFAVLGKPLQGQEFIDIGLINNKLYEYKVQALVVLGDTRQAGGKSMGISGVPRDLTPPAQPKNLVAVKTATGVKLVWQVALSDDIAGYRIYRREGNSVEAELIAEIGFELNQYVDRDMIEGSKRFYSVTSFDKAQPPNESIKSAESSVGGL